MINLKWQIKKGLYGNDSVNPAMDQITLKVITFDAFDFKGGRKSKSWNNVS